MITYRDVEALVRNEPAGVTLAAVGAMLQLACVALMVLGGPAGIGLGLVLLIWVSLVEFMVGSELVGTIRLNRACGLTRPPSGGERSDSQMNLERRTDDGH